MPDNTKSMKEDQEGPKNWEIIQGLEYNKNTVRWPQGTNKQMRTKALQHKTEKT